MRATIHGSSARRGVSAPLKWALGISIALHLALAMLIQDQPGGDPSLRGMSLLDAWIEPHPPSDVPVPAPVRSSRLGTSDEGSAPEPAPVAQPRSDAAAPRPDLASASDPTGGRPQPTPTNPSPGMEMPFVRDPTYYAMAALDTPPRLVGSAELCYPQGAVGEVTFQIAINEHGGVDEASIVSVKPQGLFTGAAVELCSRLKFTPATKGGRTVRSRVRLVVGQPAT